MTGWIIFGSIVLFFLIILWQSVTVIFDYENKLSLKVKFMFFTLFTTDPKPKKKKKPKKEKQPKKKKNTDKKPTEASVQAKTDSIDEKTAEKPEKNDEKNSPEPVEKAKKKFKFTLDDLDMIMDYVKSASPPIKRLFKKIRWYDVYVDWVVASDDAAKTALNYGRICAVLYPFFKWLTTYFTAHVKEINIEPDFSKEKSDIFAYFVIKLRLSTALTCGIWLGVRLIKTFFKYNSSSTPKKKGK